MTNKFACLAAAVALSSFGVAGAAVATTKATKPAAGHAITGTPAAVEAAWEKDYPTSWGLYQALNSAAKGGRKLTPSTAPDWTGVWQRDAPGSPFRLDAKAKMIPGTPYSETTAQLTPKYKAALDQKMKDIADGLEWDRLSWCMPVGFPRFLAEPFLREFIVTPTETWMTHEQVDETRRIFTDGRAHMEDDDPLWEGDSIGFWAGDTLVIHTDHNKAGQYQRGNPDYSFHISTVELVRLVTPGHLEDQIIIYDPDSLVKPWRLVFQYSKQDGNLRIRYDACEENNNTYRGPDGSTQERKKGDPLFKDWRTFGIPEVAWDSIPK